MPVASTCMDLDIIMLREVSQRKTNILGHHFNVKLNYDKNKFIYKTETDSQAQKANLWISMGKEGFPGGARGEESACQCRRYKRGGFDPWTGRSPA